MEDAVLEVSSVPAMQFSTHKPPTIKPPLLALYFIYLIFKCISMQFYLFILSQL